MKISWYDSDKDFDDNIMTSIILRSGELKGVIDAIDMRRITRERR